MFRVTPSITLTPRYTACPDDGSPPRRVQARPLRLVSRSCDATPRIELPCPGRDVTRGAPADATHLGVAACLLGAAATVVVAFVAPVWAACLVIAFGLVVLLTFQASDANATHQRVALAAQMPTLRRAQKTPSSTPAAASPEPELDLSGIDAAYEEFAEHCRIQQQALDDQAAALQDETAALEARETAHREQLTELETHSRALAQRAAALTRRVCHVEAQERDLAARATALIKAESAVPRKMEHAHALMDKAREAKREADQERTAATRAGDAMHARALEKANHVRAEVHAQLRAAQAEAAHVLDAAHAEADAYRKQTFAMGASLMESLVAANAAVDASTAAMERHRLRIRNALAR